ncbi:hypothetical protein K443DRAFT_942 [Laccaria amethystina LaAM-08-1]|uniref:Uncharacterized protein n=1 Tax=Laccaria amethystina LaAM-08-1 TaxID=1095629 RepID=A0A0C9Y5N3_9AGAR|nr:hypothetical protein K443DRAFT_942 [Laccaria amethystina LaAM-08-1]
MDSVIDPSLLGEPPLPAPQPRRPLRREGAVIILTPEEQLLQDAMLMSSSPPPEPLLGKRTRNEDGDDEGEHVPTSPAPQLETLSPSISNLTAATLRYANTKKLRPEQRDEAEAFLLESAAGHQARLYIAILSVENKIDTFRSAAPPYQVYEELKTNINNYGLAVLLSVNISAYKGNIPINHILDILKRFRFDLPAGIEHDYANWEKVTTAVSYSLTQIHSRLKKLIKESIGSNTNIFALAQLIVHSTPCRTTVQLCARVALMRAIHKECKGSEKYWNRIDERLATIRKLADGSTSKITKAFNRILQTDRELYGADEDYSISDVVADEWQQQVDAVVAGEGSS